MDIGTQIKSPNNIKVLENLTEYQQNFEDFFKKKLIEYL